jgi:hypothetical protein
MLSPNGSRSIPKPNNQHKQPGGFGPHSLTTKGKQMILTDTSGKRWKLHERLSGDRYQIYPNHSELNIGKEDGDCPTTAITLPDHIADEWIAGRVRVKID